MPLVLSSSTGISTNGSTIAFKPTIEGALNFPNRPMFYAYNPDGLASGVVGLVFPFNLTRINVGNCYNTTTYRFTAPSNGTYEFYASALFRFQGSSSNGEIAFYKNGANVGTRGQAYCVNNITNGHTHNHTHMILDLVTGDYVDFRIWARNGGCDYYYGQNLAYFCGKQIG